MNEQHLISAFAVFVWAVVIAFAATALTVIVRNAPVIQRWVFEMRKPWACNVCMPLYTCALLVGGLCWLHESLIFMLSYLPAYLVSKALLDRMAEAPNDPEIPAMFHTASEESQEYGEEILVPIDEEFSSDTPTGPNALSPALRQNRKV